VGPDEFDVARGRISVDAPLGRALLGKREGDVVVVQRPIGATDVTVVAISWASPEEP
jgi:transcription elongation factor GreB